MPKADNCLTVKQLIEKLKKMPQDANVDTDDPSQCGVIGVEYSKKGKFFPCVMLHTCEVGW